MGGIINNLFMILEIISGIILATFLIGIMVLAALYVSFFMFLGMSIVLVLALVHRIRA